MEYGIFLPKPRPLPADPRALCPGPWRPLLPEGSLRALYFGSEFCPYLLPSPKELGAFCTLAREGGLTPVLLTPVVTQPGLEELRLLLRSLGDRDAPELLGNDWGVLQMARREFPRLRLRAGRLMNRSLRDPRLLDRRAPIRSGSGRPRLRQLLLDLGVSAIESDPDLDGEYLAQATPGLQRVLHLPYSFAATGRHCLVKADRLASDRGPFAEGLARHCPGGCRERWHELSRQDTALSLWRCGNTVFSQLPPQPPLLKQADRIVVHEVPAA